MVENFIWMAIYNKVKSNKKIHKILVCKTNEKLNEFVNKDINSVKNMIKIVSNYINTNYKPKTFVLVQVQKSVMTLYVLCKTEKYEKTIYSNIKV